MFKNYIGGEWVGGASTLANINPSNLDDHIGDYALADAAQADAAIGAAAAAAAGWAASTPQQRFDALDAAGSEILARRADLGDLLAREEGKTLPEATGEVARAGQIFKFFAGEALRPPGELLPSVRPGGTVEITREPLGVVTVISPWNFPIASPALEDRAGAGARQLCGLQAGAGRAGQCLGTGRDPVALRPAGWRLQPGDGQGRRDWRQAARGPAYFGRQLHRLGRYRPARGADLRRPRRGDGQVPAGNGGQEPVGDAGRRRPGHRGELRRQRRVLLDRAALHGQLAADRHEGGKLVQGGRPFERNAEGARGHYLEPALFAETSNAMRISREEVFGPVANIVRVKGYEEALATANDTDFGLSAGICTTSLKYATHFKRHVQAGMVMVNVPTAGVDYHVPFGGRKGSSYGAREQGRHAVEFYTAVKTAYTFAG